MKPTWHQIGEPDEITWPRTHRRVAGRGERSVQHIEQRCTRGARDARQGAGKQLTLRALSGVRAWRGPRLRSKECNFASTPPPMPHHRYYSKLRVLSPLSHL